MKNFKILNTCCPCESPSILVFLVSHLPGLCGTVGIHIPVSLGNFLGAHPLDKTQFSGITLTLTTF